MPIYARTEEGQWAAYNPESALPRKLRSLLKVIDGKTSMGVYVQTLSAFGNVQSIFTSLLSARLIEPVLAGAVRASPPVQAVVQDILQKPLAGNQWHDTQPPARTTAPAFTGLSTAAWSADAPSTAMLERSMQNGSTQNLEVQRGLNHAVALMSDFVLLHLPAQAFAVLKELEDLQSIEQLAATFGGYEQIVKSVGAPSDAHLQQLRRLVAQHM